MDTGCWCTEWQIEQGRASVDCCNCMVGGRAPPFRAYLLDNGKNPGFSIVVAVGTDSLEKSNKLVLEPTILWNPSPASSLTHQINLVGVLVGPERPHKPKESIFGGLGHDLRREVCC